jgi:hypothetical protein
VEIINSHQKPKVYFHSRYDGETLEGTHLQNASEVLHSLFELCDANRADFSITLDYSAENLKLLETNNIPNENRFLIVREPKQVLPYPHTKKARRDFGSIFYLGTHDGTNSGATAWPYSREFRSSASAFASSTSRDRENKVVAIASWRVSFIRGSLYSLRAKSFSEFEIDTFGRGWEAPPRKKIKEVLAQIVISSGNEFGLARDLAPQIFYKPKNYKGSLESKFQTLQKYKSTLIIENSLDYMSEKVLDAFSAATLPIYCGADLSYFDIPRDLYVSCAPDLKSVANAIGEAREIDYESWRERVLSWMLTKNGLELFDEKLQWERVLKEVRIAMLARTGGN